jgi:hypothetical protein
VADDALAKLGRIIDAGQLRVPVADVLPLEEQCRIEGLPRPPTTGDGNYPGRVCPILPRGTAGVVAYRPHTTRLTPIAIASEPSSPQVTTIHQPHVASRRRSEEPYPARQTTAGPRAAFPQLRGPLGDSGG